MYIMNNSFWHVEKTRRTEITFAGAVAGPSLLGETKFKGSHWQTINHFKICSRRKALELLGTGTAWKSREIREQDVAAFTLFSCLYS